MKIMKQYTCVCSDRVAVMINDRWKTVCLCEYVEELSDTVEAERGANTENMRLLIKAIKILMS